MPRQRRKKSNTGVYHVMLRGINQENIFHEESDYLKFEKILRTSVTASKSDQGSLLPSCKLHAYCLMTNHVHLLIEESGHEIGSIMKSIGVSYVSYYNKHYDRRGPLFEGRFKSEPVEDRDYFIRLLQYIHQNPVVAGMVTTAGDFKWSSWHEYAAMGSMENGLCCLELPFSKISKRELCEMVLILNERAEGAGSQISPSRMTDNQALTALKRLFGNQVNIEELKLMSKPDRREILKSALSLGVGVRQLSRLTGVDYSEIRRLS